MYIYVLGWPKSSFRFFCKMLRKNLNKFFGQPNLIVCISPCIMCFPAPQRCNQSLLQIAEPHPTPPWTPWLPSNRLILCRPLLLLPSIFPSIRVFSNESVLHIRWPKYWRFSFSISSSNEYSGLISFRMDWFRSPCCPRVFPIPQFKSIKFFGAQLSLQSNSHIHSWLLEKP